MAQSEAAPAARNCRRSGECVGVVDDFMPGLERHAALRAIRGYIIVGTAAPALGSIGPRIRRMIDDSISDHTIEVTM